MKLLTRTIVSSVALLSAVVPAGLSAASVIDRFDFNDPAGTSIGVVANSGPGGSDFGNFTGLVTDGLGSLVYDDSSGNAFNPATGGFSATEGVYEVQFHLGSMTRVSGNINAGFALRNSTGPDNFAPLLFAQNGTGDGLRILSFNSEGFFQLFDYGAGINTVDNVTIRAVLTLNGTDPGTVDVYATDDDVDMGAGVGIEALLGTIDTPANTIFDGVSTYKQFFDESGEVATIDFLEVSIVPEPASLVLAAAGLALAGCRRRSGS